MLLTFLSALAVAGVQDVREPSSGYHTMPDIRQQPTAAQLAPVVAPTPAHRSTAGPRPAPSTATPEEQRAQNAALRQQLPPSLQFDVEPDGRHWVRGSNYKASFGAEGATFIPFLGSEAPRNYPLTFALTRAEQGGAVASLEAPSVTRTGERLVLDQGAVRSEYVAMLGGVEQLFVLDAPLGEGELVLDVAFATELAARPDGAGWRFENELGAVSYGAAFVLDAEGRRLDLATTSTGEGFRFTVPAEFLAGAAWPIAIDPLITNVTIDTSPGNQHSVDVAYDPTTGQYLVVFAEVFSSGDDDIKSWLVNNAWTVVPSSARYIDFTSTNRTDPCIAMTNVRRNFLCAYAEGPVGSRRIGARPRNADTSVVGTEFIVDDGSANDRFQPDICGDAYTPNNVAYYTIVWRRFWNTNDSDITARVVTETGAFLTGELFITNFVGLSDEEPSISKCIPQGPNDSVVVWRRGSQVLASLLVYNGLAVRSELLLHSSLAPVSNPQVSGLSLASLPGSVLPTFVAVWDADYGSDRDIEAIVCSADSSAATPTLSGLQPISFLEHVDFLLDQREPDVACMGDRWVISQNAVFPGFTDRVIRATTVNLVGSGLGVSERFLPLTLTFDETLTPRTASRHEAGETGGLEALTGWIQQPVFAPQGDVYGAVHAASPANTCAAQFSGCVGNPNGTFPYQRAFLWVEGDFSTTGTKRLHAGDMHYNAFGYFLTSLTVQNGVAPPNSAGVVCLGGSIGRYSNFVLNSGATGSFFLDINPAAISQPTGSVPALAGQTWFFQAWHRDVTAGGAPSSNFTNAAGIPFQ